MRRRTVAAAAGAACAVVVLGAAGVSALQAARALEGAQGQLRTVQDLDGGAEATTAALASADAQVDRAQRVLGRWPVDVVAAVPLLGRSWTAERAVASTAQEVLTGATVLDDRLATVRASGGGVDLPALAAAREALEAPARRSRTALDALERVSTGLTPPQVQDGVADAEDALGDAVTSLERAASGLDVLSGVLGGSGPRSVLVMLQNNAELRGAGGYSASYATGRLEDGRLVLGALQDVAAAGDPAQRARRVDAPPEYVEDFGPLSGNTTIWRSWNLSPHVPDSALVGARVAGELLPQEPDLVVLLDVPALGALAALGDGGVTLPDGSAISPQQLTDALLVDAYARAGDRVEDQLGRRAELQAAATAAVTRLVAGGVPAASAGRTLGRLSAGRHLSVWSARPEEQAALVELGAAGAVEPPPDGDLAHVSVNNLGSNKLDLYVDREVAVDATVGRDAAEVTQSVRFTNEAPDDLVPYVAGYSRPGLVVSLAELSLPSGAELVSAEVDGEPWTGSVHTGGSRQRLSARLEIPRGDTAELQVRYRLPLQDGRYRLRLVPQPLAADADLSVTVRPDDGLVLRGGAGTVQESGPFRTTREVSVRADEPQQSLWQNLREWWGEPVEVG